MNLPDIRFKKIVPPPIEEDGVIYYDGYLSFFTEIEGQLYFIHWYDEQIVSGIEMDSYFAVPCTAEDKLQFCNNQLEFCTLLENAFVILVYKGAIVSVLPLTPEDRQGFPERGVYYSESRDV